MEAGEEIVHYPPASPLCVSLGAGSMADLRNGAAARIRDWTERAGFAPMEWKDWKSMHDEGRREPSPELFGHAGLVASDEGSGPAHIILDRIVASRI